MDASIRELLLEPYVLLDGGMWRVLEGMGLGNEPTELWNLTHPESVGGVHRAYVDAGARIIYTNTLGANRIRLRHAGLVGQLSELNRAGVAIARGAALGKALVAGDMSSTGVLLEPYGKLSVAEAEDVFCEQASVLAESGVDLLVVETMIDLREAEAAARGIRKASNLPFICTLSFKVAGRTAMGDRPAEIARRLGELGAAAIGANCGTGATDMVRVIDALMVATNIPLVAKPNAGLPRVCEGKTVFPESPTDMAASAKLLTAAGARFIGGCCGSTPEHIAAICRALQ